VREDEAFLRSISAGAGFSQL